MFKPKQIAPFFSLTPMQLSEILREIQSIYPLNQTPLGSFLITEKDLAVIETYIKIKHFFKNKKLALVHMNEYLKKKNVEENERPEWLIFMKNIY